jgi:integrase
VLLRFHSVDDPGLDENVGVGGRPDLDVTDSGSDSAKKNPCTRVKLPKRTGGRRVTRTVLTSEQVSAIVGKLKEPYATLVLFLAASGLRIGEALAIKWTDFKKPGATQEGAEGVQGSALCPLLTTAHLSDEARRERL